MISFRGKLEHHDLNIQVDYDGTYEERGGIYVLDVQPSDMRIKLGKTWHKIVHEKGSDIGEWLKETFREELDADAEQHWRDNLLDRPVTPGRKNWPTVQGDF